jgi:hypothetical protein
MKAIALTLTLCAQAAVAAGPVCQATSAPTPPLVVELYTSEGCSSCPPADRWLSTLKGRSDVLPLAFHVTYWDRLGWPDRYALPEATARQYELARTSGQDNVYTPQVVAGGKDWRSWPRLPAAAAPAGPALTLERDGERVTVQVAAAPAGPARLAGYWAVLEDGHQSAVRAGENAGETLRHDHVVRLYRPVPAWAAANGHRAELTVSRGVPGTPRRVVFIVTDPATQRPVQAAVLAC